MGAPRHMRITEVIPENGSDLDKAIRVFDVLRFFNHHFEHDARSPIKKTRRYADVSKTAGRFECKLEFKHGRKWEWHFLTLTWKPSDEGKKQRGKTREIKGKVSVIGYSIRSHNGIFHGEW